MNLRKLCITGLLAGSLLIGSVSAASFTVAGEVLSSSAVPTFSLNDRTYVPLRAIAQRLDPTAKITWNNATLTASVTSDTLQFTATKGENWIQANGRYFYAADGVRIVNNSVMVPIRTLAAAMGASVHWDPKTSDITVTRGVGSPGEAPYTEDEVYWLSRIISAESQGEPLEGKLAVGTVVLNRVASTQFPNTIYGVIFDRKWGTQFTPVDNGAIYWAPTAESIIAAKLCLEGTRVAGNSLYFLDPSKSRNFWVMENRPFITTIGCHWFYG